jgi:hypothetical protein
VSNSAKPLWTIGTLEDDDSITYVAFRQNIPNELRQSLTEQFIVEWAFAAPREDGLPNKEELNEAQRHQHEIQTELESGGEAILAFITLGGGYRELFFYCRESLVIRDRFNRVVAGRILPVELNAGHDPEWRVFDEFVKPLTNLQPGSQVQ